MSQPPAAGAGLGSARPGRDPAPAPRRLRRELGLFTAALLVVGGIIGSGIFITPAEVAKALPNGSWVLAVWALGGVVAFAGALTYAELGAMLPEAGGAYVYVQHGFGALTAFLYGWMILLSIATGALAAVAVGFASYLARFVDLAPAGGSLGVAATTIVIMAGVNYLGVKPGATVQNILSLAKVTALAALIVGGIVVWAGLGGDVSGLREAAPSASLSGFAAALTAVLFTIGGWQQMNMLAGEIRDPARTIPRALGIGIAIVVAIYIGANVVYLRALGRDGLALSTAVAADTAARMVGPLGATLLSVAAMLSVLGFVNVVLLANSRIVYAMATDGVFFSAAAKVHPRFGSPHVALGIMTVWALLLLAFTRGDLGALLSGVVFADWIFFGLGGASVFALRRRMPHAPRPYRVLGYPWLPALFVLAAVAGVASAVVASPAMSALGAAQLVAGVAAYKWLGRAASHRARAA
ncbi:MAG: APC family permease [Gemmatimonadaceae bacterium]